MNSKSFLSVLATILFSGLLLAPSARAQYTGDYQTNIISGVVSNWSGDYAIGDNSNTLFIENSAVLNNGNGLIGNGYTSSFNTAIVSGSGSIWNNTGDLHVGNQGHNNQLIITNGGAVYDNNGFIGLPTPMNDGGHSVIVTGSGSVWSNSNNLGIESVGGSTMTIADGGKVFSNTGTIGGEQQDQVLVTGNGSLWSINSTLVVNGKSTGMIITNGGRVISGSTTMLSESGFVLVTGMGSTWTLNGDLNDTGPIGDFVSISDNGVVSASGAIRIAGLSKITISVGALYATNGLGTGAIAISDGSLTINTGTVTVDQLTTKNQQYGGITFNGGVLRSKATTIISNSANSSFIVGDGTDAATFILDTGGSGFHSFANGLMISSNGALRGVGTIIGSTTFNGGGLLAPGLSPGSITFSNSLTLAPNSTFAVELDGHAEGQYDRIVALDTVSVSNSILSVSLGFTPSIGDSFTIISNLSAMAVLGTFVTSDGAALPDGADFSADGTTFEISYTGNSDARDVILTAVIPEPATWALVMLGMVVLYRRRRQPVRAHASSPLVFTGPTVTQRRHR